jgi:hypothetical protein
VGNRWWSKCREVEGIGLEKSHTSIISHVTRHFPLAAVGSGPERDSTSSHAAAAAALVGGQHEPDFQTSPAAHPTSTRFLVHTGMLDFFAIILLANFIVVPIALITVVLTGSGKSINAASTSTRVKGIAAPVPKIPKNRLFRGANAAQECNNVAFVLINGIFEGGNAAAAGRRVSGEQEHERKASSIASYRSLAAASASAEISSLHTSARPQ